MPRGLSKSVLSWRIQKIPVSDQLSLGVYSFQCLISLYPGMLSLNVIRFWVKKMFKLEPADSRLPTVSWNLKQSPSLGIDFPRTGSGYVMKGNQSPFGRSCSRYWPGHISNVNMGVATRHQLRSVRYIHGKTCQVYSLVYLYSRWRIPVKQSFLICTLLKGTERIDIPLCQDMSNMSSSSWRITPFTSGF